MLAQYTGSSAAGGDFRVYRRICVIKRNGFTYYMVRAEFMGLMVHIEMDDLNVLTLDRLEAGKPAVIVRVGGEGGIRRRLLDMGMTPGVRVVIRKTAPSGDPIGISLRGYELALRLEEAERIEIEEL